MRDKKQLFCDGGKSFKDFSGGAVKIPCLRAPEALAIRHWSGQLQKRFPSSSLHYLNVCIVLRFDCLSVHTPDALIVSFVRFHSLDSHFFCHSILLSLICCFIRFSLVSSISLLFTRASFLRHFSSLLRDLLSSFCLCFSQWIPVSISIPMDGKTMGRVSFLLLLTPKEMNGLRNWAKFEVVGTRTNGD